MTLRGTPRGDHLPDAAVPCTGKYGAGLPNVREVHGGQVALEWGGTSPAFPGNER
jgi:hypothetical protein